MNSLNSPSSLSLSNRPRWRRGAAALLLVGVGLLTAAPEALARGDFRRVAARSAIHGYAIEPLATDALRPVERAFLDKGLAAMRLQVRLAELGSSQAASADVRSHAEQLKGDSRQAVDSLLGLMRKKGAASEASVAETPAEAYTRLAARTGADFDREFVRVLGELHDEAIALFEQAAAEAKDTDVREFAAGQLPMLRAHRGRVVELKKALE